MICPKGARLALSLASWESSFPEDLVPAPASKTVGRLFSSSCEEGRGCCGNVCGQKRSSPFPHLPSAATCLLNIAWGWSLCAGRAAAGSLAQAVGVVGIAIRPFVTDN